MYWYFIGIFLWHSLLIIASHHSECTQRLSQHFFFNFSFYFCWFFLTVNRIYFLNTLKFPTIWFGCVYFWFGCVFYCDGSFSSITTWFYRLTCLLFIYWNENVFAICFFFFVSCDTIFLFIITVFKFKISP